MVAELLNIFTEGFPNKVCWLLNNEPPVLFPNKVVGFLLYWPKIDYGYACVFWDWNPEKIAP